MAKSQLSEAEAKALLQWLSTLQPVEPTAAVGNVSPDTKKPNKGLKRFLVGPGGEWGDLKSPKNWAKGLADAANDQLVQPVWEASKMKWADPSSGLSPTERLAQLMNDSLVVGSTVVPAAKGVSRGVSLLDDLARLNEARYTYGIHISPTSDLDEINVAANDMKRRWVDSEIGNNYFFDTSNLNPMQIQTMDSYLKLYSRNPEQGPTIYFTRTPRKGVVADVNHYDDTILKELNEGKLKRPTDTRKGKKFWDAGSSTSYERLPDGTHIWDYERPPTNAKNTPNKLKVINSKTIGSSYPDNRTEFIEFMKSLTDSTPSGRFWLDYFLKSNFENRGRLTMGDAKKAVVSKGKKVPK